MIGIKLPHGTLDLPTFLPDATRGYIRAVDSQDLVNCGIQAVVMNTYHLMLNPGVSTVQALGGVHAMSGWRGPIFTDSGGFQIYSLIHQNNKYGTITGKGAVFYGGEGVGKRKYQLTPQKSIQYQVNFGADVLFCLDDCTHVDAPEEVQKESVRRTIEWARRSKQVYSELLEKKAIPAEKRPLIYAILQGGGSLELRKECASELLEIGFDGYGYGGWPLDRQGNLLVEMLATVRELIPGQFPLHALGVAAPENVVRCSQIGYDLFDGAMPTRDARHGRLYVFNQDPTTIMGGLSGNWLSYVYLFDKRHTRTKAPLSESCGCLCCQNYSVGYLHHLYKCDDSLAWRLGTLHNLRFMSDLLSICQKQSR